MNSFYKTFIALLLLVFSSISLSQLNLSEIEFNTRYFEAVDKLVLVPTSIDSEYFVGYIYLEPVVGFTLERMGILIVSGEEFKITETLEELQMSLKIRIPDNANDMYLITPEQQNHLNIPPMPDWVPIYKKNSNDVSYLKEIGFEYNRVGASSFALQPLTKAYSLQPDFEGLLYELAFAFNATKQYAATIDLLKKTIKTHKKNARILSEYGFALNQSNKVKEAESVYKKALKYSNDDNLSIEICFNMIQAFYNSQNYKKFNYWVKKFDKRSPKDSPLINHVNFFKKQFKVKNK